MTEKTYTLTEINEVTNKIYMNYFQHYKADRMSFKDLALIENIIIKIQTSFNSEEVE